MPIRIDFLVDQHLSYTSVWDTMTTEQLRAYDVQAMKLLDASSYPLLHTIYDYTHAKSIPPLREMLNLKAGKHPKVGWVVFVNVQDIMLRFILSSTAQLFRLRLRMMNSVDEALEFLQSVDSTLPNLTGSEMKQKLRTIQESVHGIPA
jgi:hypothetical protein